MRRGQRPGPTAVLALAVLSLASPLHSQELAEAVLSGQTLLSGEPLVGVTVTLHQVAPDSSGELLTTESGPDGSFELRLPHVPDPENRAEIFFASVRYHGILYFGAPLSEAAQLDSPYLIEAYDTVSAPVGGADLAVGVRNLFIEPFESVWRATDLFQLVNESDRTLVAREGDVTWSHALPAGARDLELGQGDLAPEQIVLGNEAVQVTAPIPPGERLVVIRYTLDVLETTVPMQGRTERAEILIREPAPPLDVIGLTALPTVELEEGSSYRRFAGDSLRGITARLVQVDPPSTIPMGWFAVIMALVLAGVGIVAFKRPGPPARETADGAATEASPSPGIRDARRKLVLEIAQLDEAHSDETDPTRRDAYLRSRGELLARLRGGG